MSKGLINRIRSGELTKPALESSKAKYEADKLECTRAFGAQRLGKDLYMKQISELNFAIELLHTLIDKFEDFKLPAPAPMPVADTSNSETSAHTDDQDGGYNERFDF